MFPAPRVQPGVCSALLLALVLPGAVTAAPGAAPQPAPSPALILSLQGHKACIFHVAYSPDGKHLATTSVDGTVHLWEASTGKSLRVLEGHKGEVYGSAFSPDGRLLASGGEDGKVLVWDTTDGTLMHTLEGPGNELYVVAFSPDGQTVAGANRAGQVRVWSVKRGRALYTLTAHAARVCGLAFSPNGERLVSACGVRDDAGSGERGGEVKVWDAASGDLLMVIPGRELGILTVAFSADGKRLAGACLDGTVRVWEAATGLEVLVLKGHPREVYSVAFSPDGRWLASCGGKWDLHREGEFKVWDLATGREVASLPGPGAPVWSVAFRPAGPKGSLHLASAAGRWRQSEPRAVRVWDLTALTTSPLTPPTERELEPLWNDLGGKDAARAYRAVWSLTAAPQGALALLGKRLLPPKPSTDRERIARLVADLDNDAFATRQKATAELLHLGLAARPALRRALQSSSAEVRRRSSDLLQRLKNQPEPLPSMEEVRALRAIEVLQHLDRAAARPLLEKLARGAPDSLVTRDAAWVLARKQPGRPARSPD